MKHETERKAAKTGDIRVINTKKKLETFVTSLKSSFHQHLKSHVVYEFTFSGYNSTYAGQHCRTDSIADCRASKQGSLVGQKVKKILFHARLHGV